MDWHGALCREVIGPTDCAGVALSSCLSSWTHPSLPPGTSWVSGHKTQVSASPSFSGWLRHLGTFAAVRGRRKLTGWRLMSVHREWPSPGGQTETEQEWQSSWGKLWPLLCLRLWLRMGAAPRQVRLWGNSQLGKLGGMHSGCTIHELVWPEARCKSYHILVIPASYPILGYLIIFGENNGCVSKTYIDFDFFFFFLVCRGAPL